ncbi:MAG: hypothetical protein LUE27_08070 [Clostridia bacterium]|nr:hypothetical protein [Clostridia bacterium]
MEAKIKKSKKSAIIIIAVGMALVTALFIADWIRLGSSENSAIPETKLFAGWLIFIFPSAISLLLFIPDYPLASVIIDGFKTICVCLYYTIMINLTGYRSGMQITGIQTLFEAYGDRIMEFASMYAAIAFFVLNVIVCTVWIVRRRADEGRSCSGAERAWLALGFLTLALWTVMAVSYYEVEGGVWMYGAVPALIYFALGLGWWFASRRYKTGSIVLFILLTISAIVSSSTTFLVFSRAEPAYLFIPILELAGVIAWYVFMCILLKRRWGGRKLAAA